MKTKKLQSFAFVFLMQVFPFGLCAQPEGLLLWNTMDSKEDVVHSKVGPDILLTSHLISHWAESKIEYAKYDRGLFINNGLGGSGWYNGANFFALDNQAMGLSAERGTIEFWFKFEYDCTIHNHAYIFSMENDLVSHYSSWPPARPGAGFTSGWSGWNANPVRKFYFMYAQNGIDGVSIPLHLPEGSTVPGQDMEFYTNQLTHFAFVWDINGIEEGDGDKMRIYVDGELKGATDAPWTTTGGILNYTYLGTTPNRGSWDHHYNGLYGVMDNLKVWNYAKTDYEDRHFEGFITCPEDVTIECDASTDPSETGEPEVVVNCEGDVVVTHEDAITSGVCSNESTIERTWTITDACGNVGSCAQTINIVDTSPPVITGIPAEPLVLPNDPGECGAIPDYSFIEALDACGSAAILTYDPPDGALLPAGNTFVEIIAKDACGNMASESLSVDVINTPPEIIDISVPKFHTVFGESVDAIAVFEDDNLFKASWNWGYGHYTDGLVEGNIISGSFEYPKERVGIYTLTINIIDYCYERAESEFKYITIYNHPKQEDPPQTQVSGAGKFTTHTGVMPNHPNAAGPVNFALLVRQLNRGSSQSPVGDIRAHFNAGNMNFESTHIKSMTASASQAIIHGKGTITRSSGLKEDAEFSIGVFEGAKDMANSPAKDHRVRILIAKASENAIDGKGIAKGKMKKEVIFDNVIQKGIGAAKQVPSISSRPYAPLIERGNILIQIKKAWGKDARLAGLSINPDESEDLFIYPNPANQYLSIRFPANFSINSNMNLHLYNLTGVDLIQDIQQSRYDKSLLLDIEMLPAGIYILTIPEFSARFKFAKN